MQVVHDNNGITHAVLGKGETLDYRATTSAQVLFLVSTGLYKYPRLASVREIICNAWDAHIASGKRDCPLDITINSKGMFSVRDFGTGIPHDKIQDIYMTAGDSTKVESDEETGGFGLGSKAPFAYRDHFTVISTCDGIRTMYAMAMSDSQSMGKPTAKVLHQGPGEKNGMEVQMQLRTEDVEQFEKIIRRVVYMGDINATFNGQPMTVCGMDQANSDMSFLAKKYDGDMYTNLQIGIRYGAVVYPLEIDDDFRNEFNELIRLLRNRFGGLRKCMLVLRAKPNSISMVPSREALLYNPRTTATIIEMLNNAIKVLSSAISNDHRKHLQLILKKLVLSGYSMSDLLSWRTNNDWPHATSNNTEKDKASMMLGLSDTYAFADTPTEFEVVDLLYGKGNAHTPADYGVWFVVHNYDLVMSNDQSRAFWRSEVYRLATLFGDFNSKTVRLLGRSDKMSTHAIKRVLRSQITLPFLRATRELMPDAPKKLYAFVTSNQNAPSATRWLNDRRAHILPATVPVFNMFPNRLSNILPTLCDPVIMLMWDSKYGDAPTTDWYQDTVKNPKHAFIYLLKLTQGKHDARAIAKQLHKYGFKIIDRTEQHNAYLQHRKIVLRQRAAEVREYKAQLKKKGELKEKRATKESIASLANVINDKGVIDMDSWLKITKPVMVEGPEAVLIRRVNDKAKSTIDDMSLEITQELLKRYKSRVGITNRGGTAQRFYDAGAKQFGDLVIEDLKTALKNSPEILQYASDVAFLENKKHHLNSDYYMRSLLYNALALPQFCHKLGLPSLNIDQQFWLSLYVKLECRGRYVYWNYNSKDIHMPNPSKNLRDVLAKMDAAKCSSRTLLKSVSSYVVTKDDLKKMHPTSQADLTDFLFKITNL